MNITQDMYNVLLQQQRILHIRVNLLNFEYTIVGELSGYVIGKPQISIDANSDIRRTCNISMVVKDIVYDIDVGQEIFLDKYVKIYFGVDNVRNNEIVWFNQGIYLINQPSVEYSGDTNTLSFQGVDLMAKLTGMRNGYLEGIPSFIAMGSEIRGAVISALALGGFTNYIIDIKENEDKTPYNINLDVGATVFDVISRLRDCYSGYQTYFDEDGVFHFEQIPVTDKSQTTVIKNGIDENTLLMLHCDELPPIDSSLSPKVVTNNRTTLNNNGKFDKCISFNGTDSALTTPSNNVFSFGNGDWTIDFWLYLNDYSNWAEIIETAKYNESTNKGTVVQFGASSFDVSEKRLAPIFYTDGTNFETYRAKSDTDFPLNTWTHVAIVKNNNNGYVFQNGLIVASLSNLGNININSGSTIVIGSNNDIGGNFLNGNIDEFRISNVARWTTNFTPPSKPYALDKTITIENILPVLIDDTMWSRLHLSHTNSVDFEKVKNVIEVMGKSYDIKYYGATTTVSGNQYTTTIDALTSLGDNTLIGFTAPSIIENPTLKINNFTSYPIVNEDGTVAVIPEANQYYVVLYKENKFYFMGYQQVRAIAKDLNPNSPFYVNGTTGEIRIVLSGGEYDNIPTNKLALDRAKYEVYLRSRVNDSLIIETVPIYFADVYNLISFTLPYENAPKTYIIQNVSTSDTQRITCSRFYPLYPYV